MKHFYASAAIFLLALPAQAITPAEVVANIEEVSRITGQTFTFNETERDGNDITLHEWQIVIPSKTAETVISSEWIRFSDMGDGSVNITQSAEIDISVTIVPDYGETKTVNMQLLVAGSSYASGDYDNVRYVYGPKTVELRFDLSNLDDVPDVADLTILFYGTAYDYVQTFLPEDHIGFVGGVDFSSIDISGNFADSEKPATAQINGAFQMISSMFDVNMGPMPERGFYGPADNTGTSSSTFGPFEMNVAAQNTPDGDAQFSMTFDNASIVSESSTESYQTNQEVNGINVEMTGGDLPVEQLRFGVDTISGGVILPVGVSNAIKDIAFKIQFDQLWVGEEMWATFDPEQILPRDPANFLLDMSGKVRMFVDLFDLMNEVETPPQDGSPVAEMVSFDLNAFSVDIAGATLLGMGGVTFPNNGKLGDNDIPEPIGKFTFSVQGAQALINSLGQLPMVPAEFAFGAMSAIGMFGRSTGEADSFESVIELGPNNSVMVNGMKMQ